MKLLYSLSLFLYSLLIKIASLFNEKAKQRYNGTKETFHIIQKFKGNKVIWIHCASLGEFEQGRPLIEKIKNKNPDCQIALSFFSPSGFEVQKNYKYADVVFYLPSDNKTNSKRLIKALNPKAVFFVKYEFWHFYLSELKKMKIPIYLVSGIFREKQIFFKVYGEFYRNILKNFSTIFVQNNNSLKLLQNINIKNVIVTGDTRFDRVFEISQQKKSFPIIEKFSQNKFILVAGSTWEKDEEILINFINETQTDVKFIIAPHEIKKENISRIKSLINKNVIVFSEIKDGESLQANVLIIDNVGMLSSLYAYADVAYIGGGFGKGIHNTLEAAVFGVPIVFGTKYSKFDEAKELIKRKAAFSISNNNEFNEIFNKLIANKNFKDLAGNKSKDYVYENVGASDKILNQIVFKKFLLNCKSLLK